MSIREHPRWQEIVPRMVVVRGDDVRVSFENLPADLADELALWVAPCLHCGRPRFAVRIRPKIGYEIGGDYLPTCPSTARPACSTSLRLHHELGKLAMIAAGRNNPQPHSQPSRGEA